MTTATEVQIDNRRPTTSEKPHRVTWDGPVGEKEPEHAPQGYRYQACGGGRRVIRKRPGGDNY